MRVLLRRFARDESGAVLIYVTMIIMVLVGMTGLSVNFAFRHVEVNRLQIAADAAALAGASELALRRPAETVRSVAIDYAMENMPSRGEILVGGDVEIGNWNSARPRLPEDLRFQSGGAPENAVMVTTRRAGSNAHQLFMAGFPGTPSTVDLSVQSIAWLTRGETSSCYSNGMIAGGTLSVGVGGGSGTVAPTFCLHGEGGVVVGSSMTDLPPNVLSAPPGVPIVYNSGHSVPSALLPDERKSIPPTDPAPLVQNFKDLTGPFPDYVNAGNVVDVTGNRTFNTGNTQEGTIYRVSGSATIDADIRNVVIIANNGITINGNGNPGRRLRNVGLVSGGSISGNTLQLGSVFSNNANQAKSIGCDQLEHSVFMLATGNMTFGNGTNFSSVQLIAGGNITTGNSPIMVGSNSFQAGGTISAGNSIGPACPGDDHILIPGEDTGPLLARLVR